MKSQNSQKIILFVSLVIVMLGFGIAIPLMPFFITHFKASASALGWIMSLYSLMQFIFAPVWGRLSDRYGRKPILLFGIAGYFFSFILQGFSQSILQLTIFRTVAGILTSATLPTAMAYIVDITDEKDRSKGVGLMGAAMGVGMIFGPMLGGVLSKVNPNLPKSITALMQITQNTSTGEMINLSIPFIVSAILALLAIPFIMITLPESLPAEKRNMITHVKKESRVKELFTGLRGPIGFLFILAFLITFALANMESVLGIYAQQIFSMGPGEIGILMGIVGVLTVIQQGVLIGPLTHKFGEIWIIRVGLIISMVGLAFLALAFNKYLLIGAAIFFNFGNALLQPSVTSLVSKKSLGGQGAAMGLNNSFQSLGRGIGPLWAGYAYDIHSTLSFWTGALIQGVALVYSLKMLKHESEIK